MQHLTNEAAAYQSAAENYRAEPNSFQPVRTMMGLALEGRNLTIRGWAATWLQENCAITVTYDEGESHAAPPAAGSLLQ